MKNCLLLGALLMGFTGVAMAQSADESPNDFYQNH